MYDWVYAWQVEKSSNVDTDSMISAVSGFSLDQSLFYGFLVM